MERTISALAVLFGAGFCCFIRFGLAGTEGLFPAKNGSFFNQTRRSHGVRTNRDAGNLLQEQYISGNDIGGGAFRFGFEVKKRMLTTNPGNRPTKSGLRNETEYGMTGPGFAYSRNRGTSSYPDETAASQEKNDGGCTAEYWSSRKEVWPRMLPIASTAAKIFGSRAMEAYGPQLTLFEGMRMEEKDGYSSLLKQSSTALLNSYSRQGFPYSAWRVKTLFIQSLVSQQAAAAQAEQFLVANEACS